MKIKSLGRETDLIFARFAGDVIDKGDYTLVQTKNNPGYHWGNFIIFSQAPKENSLHQWKSLFDREFNYYKEPHHYVFTWDTEKDESGKYDDFIEDGFEFDRAVVLTSSKLNPPKFFNQDIIIKRIETEIEWNSVLELQVLCADEKYVNEYYLDFKKAQMRNYQKMVKAEMGHWYGAFLDNKLVGDLGIFHNGEIARYQNVGTHPDFRKKGICGSLVYQAGLIAQKDYKINSLVMEADPEYHAARIYESVGFKPTETNYSLSWWKR